MILKELLFALWFFLPAGIANGSPVLVSRVSFLKKFDAPMDFGKRYKGKRVFGDHKTWRGLITGAIFSTLVLWFQQVLVSRYGWAQNLTSQIDYLSLPTLIAGPLFGIGALGGDAIESFFKRQVNRPPGSGWFPFDQTDYIIGGSIAISPFVTLGFLQYVMLLILWLLIHIVVSYLGYLTGLKERPI